MPTFEEMKNRYRGTATTIGEQLKEMSDMVMQQTFDNDIATRQCYLYDYYHDDQPSVLGGSEYTPYKAKEKIPVKLKFLVKEYKSASKDDPEAHILFQPDDINNRETKIIPQWFKEKYENLGIQFPIGLFVDIPDDRGVYWKWIIFYNEAANQFPKYGIMKCNYYFKWVETIGSSRIIREMCGVERTSNSYTSWDIVTMLCSRLVAFGNIAMYSFVYAGTP